MIGQRSLRLEDGRLLRGRGRFVDDVKPPRLAHLAVVRSPHAAARVLRVDVGAALRHQEVLGVLTGTEAAQLVEPWRGVLGHYAGMKTGPQLPLATDRVRFVGEPLVAVAARSRAAAEDACEAVEVDWERALEPGSPLVFEDLGDNVVYRAEAGAAEGDAAVQAADVLVEGRFSFSRVTGVPIEPRTIVADYEPGSGRLEIRCSTQVPHMMQAVLARILRLPEHRVRVVAEDVGGSFGIKIHVYQDEVCACLLAMRLGRPVRFTSDRQEGMLTDIHAREEVVDARLGLRRDGTIAGLTARVVAPVGAVSMYPRSSVVESGQVVRMLPGQYRVPAYRCEQLVVAQNKAPTSQYRGVGHPIATAVIEQLVERAARALGVDPAELRLHNLVRPEEMPYTSASGAVYDPADYPALLRRLLEVSAYGELRRRQAELRAAGRLPGIGISCFLETTGPGASFYGVGGAPISAKDGATVRLEPDGSVVVLVGITDQGQGTHTTTAQLVSDAVGVPPDRVRVLSGDTLAVPYGGGTWASRTAVIGGTAVLRAGRELRRKVLAFAGELLEADPADLELGDGSVSVRGTDRSIPLAELARTVHYNTSSIGGDPEPSLEATSYFVAPSGGSYAPGAHLAVVEVERESWQVRLERYVAVDDCGRVINPAVVEGQIRGGVVQGIGQALLEQIVYDADGQLRNASLMEYLLPTAEDVCDIEVHHLDTPSTVGEGFRGVGESGATAAPAAVANAVADALSPLGVEVSSLPLTPQLLFSLADPERSTRQAGERHGR